MTEPETPTEERERHLKELQGRNIAHYQVLLTAWIQTRLEHDKALIAFSSAGIGLLLTVAALQGIRSQLELVAVIVGLLAFVVCVLTALRLYKLNSDAIASELTGETKLWPKLKAHDRVAYGSFIVGLTCFSTIGIATIIHKYDDFQGAPMANPANVTKAQPLQKSVDGIQNLRPQSIQQPAQAPASAKPAQSSTPQSPPASTPANPDK